MKIGAVVQARMGSTRLPGKSLMPVWKDMSLLEMVLRRVRVARRPDVVILATSEKNNCNPLESLALSLGAEVIRGDEENVLSRFVTAVEVYSLDAVIRVCADNPLVDPGELDRLARCFELSGCDYVTNNTPESGLPDGLGAEMVRAELLVRHLLLAHARSREHVTAFISELPVHSLSETCFAPGELCLPGFRLDIDTQTDLVYMRDFLASLPEEDGPLWDAVAIVEKARQFDLLRLQS